MSSKSKSRKNIFLFFITIVISLFTIFCIYVFDLTWNTLDYKILDHLYQDIVADGDGPEYSDRIINLVISDRTYATFNSNSLDRSYMAQVNEALMMLGPNAIMYDIVFPRPSNDFADSIFTQSLYDAAYVYLPAAFHISANKQTFDWEDGVFYDLLKETYLASPQTYGEGKPYHSDRVLPQLDSFAEAAYNSGHISAISNDDGIFRYNPMLIKIDEQYFPSITLAMYLDYQNVPLDSIIVKWGESITIPVVERSFMEEPLIIPIDEKGRTFIPYPSYFENYKNVIELQDMIEFMQTEEYFDELLELFEGNFVFIGDFSSGISDLGNTTLEDEVPLLAIHTALFNAFITDSFYDYGNPQAIMLAIILSGILLAFSAFPRSVYFLLGAGPFMLIIAYFVADYYLSQSVLLPIGTYMASAFFVYLGVIAFVTIDHFNDERILRLEHKKKLEELEQARRLHVLSEIGVEITAHLNPDGISSAAYANVKRFMDLDFLAIGVFSQTENTLEFFGTNKIETIQLEESESTQKLNSLSAYCFEHQKDILITDLENEYHKYIFTPKPSDVKDHPASLIFLPLSIKNRKIGILTIQSFQQHAYSEYHINLLKNLAVYISTALDNANAYTKIEAQNDEIEKQNIALTNQKNALSEEITERKKVQEQLLITSDNVKNLLDNAGQGFLSCGTDLIVEKEYSAECRNIFEDDIAGKNVTDLLIQDDPSQKEFLRNILHDILKEANPAQVSLFTGLLPNEFVINGKNIHVLFKVIKSKLNEDDRKFMIVLTDISEKRKLESRIEQERNKLRMVIKTVTDFNDVMESITDYQDFYSRGLQAILHSGDDFENIIFEVYRQIHTFKGLFSQLEIQNVSCNLHELETQLSKIRNNAENKSVRDIEKLFEEVNLHEWLEEDLSVLRDYLGEDFLNRKGMLLISPDKVREIEQKIISLLSPMEITLLLPMIKQLRYRPIKEMLSGYPAYTEQLADRLGKMVNPFEIEGDDVLIEPERYQFFVKTLIHIFRNAVDHGIETPDERLDLEKEEFGTIKAHVKLNGSTIILTVSDDGGGIDTEKIKAKMLNDNLIAQDELESMSDQDIMMLIFRDEVTTSSEVTETSGRGIGLSAVKAELEKIGGQISIKTEVGKGTTFHFEIPIADETKKFELPVEALIEVCSNRTISYMQEDLEITVTETTEGIEKTVDLPLFPITAFIKMKGMLNGVFSMSFEYSLAKALTANFMFGGDMDIPENEMKLYVEDTVSEIANVIIGNATKDLPDMDKYVTFEAPFTLDAEAASLKYRGMEITTHTISTTDGKCTINYFA